MIFGYPRRQVRTERGQPRLDSSSPPVGSSGAVANRPSLSRASPTHLMNGGPIATTWAGGEAQPQPQPPHPRPALPHLDAQRPPDQRPVGRGPWKKTPRPMARLSDPDGDQQTAGRRAARQPDVPGHSILHSTHGLSSKPNDASTRYLSSILIFNYYSRAPPHSTCAACLPACRRSVRHAIVGCPRPRLYKRPCGRRGFQLTTAYVRFGNRARREPVC